MLAGRCDAEEAKAVWAEVMVYLKKTQMYCYYMENKEKWALIFNYFVF